MGTVQISASCIHRKLLNAGHSSRKEILNIFRPYSKTWGSGQLHEEIAKYKFNMKQKYGEETSRTNPIKLCSKIETVNVATFDSMISIESLETVSYRVRLTAEKNASSH